MVNKIIVAIDGYSSCGKSTVAKALAKYAGYTYVDTGAMYRAMAYYFLQNNISAEDEEAIAKACPNVNVTIVYENNEQQVILNGENVNAYLRTEEVGNMASATSVNADVRRKMVQLQQQLAKTTDVIMDGRDIGTVVFPDAELKIFMTADAEVRARRRYDELTAKGDKVTLEEILENVIARDKADMEREISPLRQAVDAVVLDNSRMTVEEQMEWFMERYSQIVG